ncbi:MAG: type II toxin-antitoxin system VapC family toxin [Runella sp.]
MEQPKYLMDTNVVIDYLGNKLPVSGMDFMNTVIDAVPKVSVVTKIELLGFNAPEQHYKTLSDFINDAIVLNLTQEVVEACIGIRKKHKTKLPDAVIAATALVHNLILITRNLSDFKNIDGLKVNNPHSL